jgi:hypothetical protein
MRNHKNKKLTLNRQTLRPLGVAHLDHVRAGIDPVETGFTYCVTRCASECPACPSVKCDGGPTGSCILVCTGGVCSNGCATGGACTL